MKYQNLVHEPRGNWHSEFVLGRCKQREVLHPLAPSENYSYKGSVHDDTPGDHLIEVHQTSKLQWV